LYDCDSISWVEFRILVLLVHLVILRAQELKKSKKEKMKDIIKAMEAFNENLVGGKRLVKALEKDTVGTPRSFVSAGVSIRTHWQF
jgi:hypothetical protein